MHLPDSADQLPDKPAPRASTAETAYASNRVPSYRGPANGLVQRLAPDRDENSRRAFFECMRLMDD